MVEKIMLLVTDEDGDVRPEIADPVTPAEARILAPGKSDFSVGTAVDSISSPATRFNRYSNDPANDHEVRDSMFVADALPPALAPRSSCANAALGHARTRRRTAAWNLMPPSVTLG